MLKKFLIPSLLLSSACFAAPTSATTNGSNVAQPSVPRYNNNLFIEADFIYWVAKQQGNDYAVTGNAITVPGTTDPNTGLTPGSVSKGRIYSGDSDLNPGFKVGVGLNMAHDQWDLFAEYTFLHGSSHDSVSSNNLNSGILPIFSYVPNNSIESTTIAIASSGGTNFVSSASSSWSLNFNNVNLELGRVMKLYPFLSLRPHFGLQSSWQRQELKLHYNVSSTTTLANAGNNRVRYHQDFWGIGLRAGLDGVWQCCDHFGLFVNTAVSALWGMFKGHATSYDTNIAAGYENVQIANQTNSPHTISPVVQLLAGAQTDWILCDKYLLLIQAGWEEQVWFFQNQHSSAIADTSLILQGLTVKCRFDF